MLLECDDLDEAPGDQELPVLLELVEVVVELVAVGEEALGVGRRAVNVVGEDEAPPGPQGCSVTAGCAEKTSPAAMIR